MKEPKNQRERGMEPPRVPLWSAHSQQQLQQQRDTTKNTKKKFFFSDRNSEWKDGKQW